MHANQKTANSKHQKAVKTIAIANLEDLMFHIDMSNDSQYQISLFEAVINASQDGILVVDHETGKVRKFNSRFLEIWRIPKELANSADDKEMIGFVLSQLTNPVEFIKVVESLYANPNEKSFDILNFKDERIFERHSEPLLIEGQVKGRVWYFRDITEKVRTESLLVQSARMATLGEMAGGIAHEINTPLATIILNSELIQESSNDDTLTKEDLSKRLSSIIQTSDKISRIIMGMKYFSRDTGREEIANFKLSKLVSEVTHLCREKFINKGIELRIDETQFEQSIQGRFGQLSQVVINLLGNSFEAIKAQPEKWISIEGYARENYFEILITDSGAKIKKEVAAKMFQPFFTTKNVGEGIGIGLSVAKGITEGHGGKLKYDETSARTRFSIHLPIKQMSQAVA